MKRTYVFALAVAGTVAVAAFTAHAHDPSGRGGYWHGYPGMMHGYGGHPGMMREYGPGYGGHRGMMHGYGPGYGGYSQKAEPMTADAAKAIVERHLARQGSAFLKVGKVDAKDDKIVVDVVTKDGGKTAYQVEFDAKTGAYSRMR